jgi:hypothetical protein
MKLCFLLIIVATVAACATTIQPGKPFSDSERRFFDDGMDVVEDVTSIQGQFGFDAREALDARCNLADVIAEVTVVSVQDTAGVGGVGEKRIEVKVDRIIYGDLSAGEVNLISNANALGYTLLNRYESVLNGSKMLFLRTFVSAEENEDIGHHFHLSPGTEAIGRSVATFVAKRIEAESKRRDGKKKSTEASESDED